VTDLSLAEYQALLRNDFYAFVERSFYELNSGAKFLRNWHNELIASELEACRRGETTRLIMNVPPRSLKSHCASIAFPAFILGHNPTAQIICASYGQDLSNKLALDCRSLLNASWYQELFPTRLSAHRQALSEFMTKENGFRLATSVGGPLTGRGGDFIIIDDACKPEEALSEVTRNTVNQWFDHTLYSRQNDKQNGCIIVIQQRLHEDDLVGHILQRGEWKVVSLPAIAVEDEIHTIKTPYGSRTVRRSKGEALHPERESLETLQNIRNTQGEYNFSGQYQQDPAPLGGGLVKSGWFRKYVVGEEPAKFDLVFQSWDTAVKTTELNNYSVCTSWGAKGQNLYLLNVLRRRMEFPDLKRSVREQARVFNASTILIEDKSSGSQLIQELLRDGLHAVTRYEPRLDKPMRLYAVTSTIENGFVYLPEKAEWLVDYLHEMSSFPKGRFNDQCDSTSQALDWFKSGYRSNGFERWILRDVQDPKSGATSEQPAEVCPSCKSSSFSDTGPQKRCYDCGRQWGQVSKFQWPTREVTRKKS
jgi:predicted phage terminase large subunit-like protein